MNITLYGGLDMNKTYKVFKVLGPLKYSKIAAESIVKESKPQRTYNELIALRDEILKWRRAASAFYKSLPVDPFKAPDTEEAKEIDDAATETIKVFDDAIASFRSEASYQEPAPAVSDESEQGGSKSMVPLAIAGIAAFLLLKG